MLYPFVFAPIFKDRIWGGRELERLYGKNIPQDKPIGEAWEISDRPGDLEDDDAVGRKRCRVRAERVNLLRRAIERVA